MKTLCVYCASSDRIDPAYHRLAAETGAALASAGWGLVYGGGNTGMMGAVAREAKANGARVTGVIPQFMIARELAYKGADELITVETMRERRRVMEERADAFLALPGGWGTLEELIEILVLRQLDKLHKPVVILNHEGFYDDLLRFFRRMVAERFNRETNLDLFHVANDLPGALALAASRDVKRDERWFDVRAE
ncbi:TIGR00730 family Rossman fold protein [Nibricoccus sp. IMCC34717]|uniref:LOG family protein n=1 Tax=Nibricoccus sp. IMCC34717 TaxID=3034021 RepID=UPI00384BAC9B